MGITQMKGEQKSLIIVAVPWDSDGMTQWSFQTVYTIVINDYHFSYIYKVHWHQVFNSSVT